MAEPGPIDTVLPMAELGGGAALARHYYEEVVAPLLLQERPDLLYACGRLGSGSDVLGLDDVVSRDHDWGLRLTLLVEEPDVADIDLLLERTLPDTFAGHPIRFATTWEDRVRQRVEVSDPVAFTRSRLGVDPTALGVLEWLSLTGQAVLEVTAGPVFYDAPGVISELREHLAWYPDDLWYYVLAAGWVRVQEELPMVGRCGARGDELGSRIIAGRIVRQLMHLVFLTARSWPPYGKWFGTMFAQLDSSSEMTAALDRAQTSTDWQTREAALAEAVGLVMLQQAHCGLPSVAQPIEPFWDREYRTLAPGVVAVLQEAMVDAEVRRLPAGVGAIEQWVDNVKVLGNADRRGAVVRAALLG